MNNSYAILIDGGFIKHKLGNSRQPMDANRVAQFVIDLQNLPELSKKHLHRVYFYDAHPLAESQPKPLSNEVVEFGKSPLFSRSKKLYSELTRLPFMALRMGEVSFSGWQVKSRVVRDAKGESLTVTADDFGPIIAQKGVDMRIGLDIASLTLKKQAGTIVLVTGDSDFVPAMKFARKEGAQLYLVPLGHGIKESMYEHADLILQMPTMEIPTSSPNHS